MSTARKSAAPTLASVPSEAEPSPGLLRRVVEELRFLVGLGLVMTALLTLVWGHYKIPSESMQPTLEVGDHIYVSKFAYGYSRHSLPFGLHNLPLPDGRVFGGLPARGDVVVFRNPNNGTVMIKRTVGLPGDRVQMRDGRLHINDALIERERIEERLYRANDTLRTVGRVTLYEETLAGSAEPHPVYERSDNAPLDNTDVYVVPQGHVFFMGDHRENSTDSRVATVDVNGFPIQNPADFGPGFVPVNNLIGRADLILFSFNRCDRDEGLHCPPRGRALSRL